MDARAAEERKFKMRQLLLEEFWEGLWSREDDCEQIKMLDAPNTAPSQSASQSASPPWDVEDGDSLPENNEGLDV